MFINKIATRWPCKIRDSQKGKDTAPLDTMKAENACLSGMGVKVWFIAPVYMSNNHCLMV